MKKKVLTIILLLIFCVALKVLFFSSDKTYEYKLKNNLNSIAVMVYDTDIDDYVAQDNVPIGSYILNEDLTHCASDGKILGYNSQTGNITLKLYGPDECYYYFDSAVEKEETFDYTGQYQTFTAPRSGDYTIEAWGAQGGNSTNITGGKGAYTKGTIHLAKDETIYIYVGGQGTSSCVTNTGGGWNGGGNPGNSGCSLPGGGASDIRLVATSSATTWNEAKSLASRIMVAAGGAGTETGTGAYGGALTGGAAYNGTYANQTSGSAFGYATTPGYDGSAGGGGYWGGTLPGQDGQTAGGGSSYISGYTGCVAIASASSTSPKSGCTDGTTDITCSYHYSEKFFTDTQMIAGNASMPNKAGGSNVTGNEGNGFVRIKYFDLGQPSATYEYTGHYETFIAPSSGEYEIEAWGAQGGNSTNITGGKGAYTKGTIQLEKNETLYIYVGGQGESACVLNTGGGWNGGGNPGNSGCSLPGGGASDIRLVATSSATTWNEATSLASRIMVAAGGAGTETGTGAYGGALNGGPAYDGSYATQTSGSAFGYATTPGYDGSAGGGGYWGGTLPSRDTYTAGGGSSYISGYTGCVAITSSSSTSPKSGCANGTTDITCSYHYSGKVFTDTQMIAGNASMPSKDGSGNVTGNEGNGYVKITKKSNIKLFTYSNTDQTYKIPRTGIYKLEVWGAQGENISTLTGGYGAYAVGIVSLNANDILHINTGEYGKHDATDSYNGGGYGNVYNLSGNYIGGGGGGATHIATVAGELKNLSSYRNSGGTNQSNEILIVAGGGGGSSYTIWPNGDLVSGANAGGIQAPNGIQGTGSTHTLVSTGGTQTTGGQAQSTDECSGGNGSFGQGGNAIIPGTAAASSAHCLTLGGGGSGWYGGARASIGSGMKFYGATGGSSYIASPNLISANGVTKHMTCNNCTTDTSANTYTISNTCVSPIGMSDCSKTGNGLVRITYLSADVVQPITVTRSILDQGTFVNVTPTYLTNQVDGADGFTIVGTATNNTNATCNGAQWYQWNYWLRWDYQIDLTNYSTIKYYARKNANHGVGRVYITDGMHNDPVCDGSTNVLLKQEIHYNDLPTSWTEYTIDVSGITGTRTISFIGGYVDSTGNSSSSTSYSNIRFLP